MKRIVLSFFTVLLFVTVVGCGASSAVSNRFKAAGYTVVNAKHDEDFSIIMPLYKKIDGFKNLYVIYDEDEVMVGGFVEFSSNSKLMTYLEEDEDDVEELTEFINGSLIFLPVSFSGGYEDLLDIFHGR